MPETLDDRDGRAEPAPRPAATLIARAVAVSGSSAVTVTPPTGPAAAEGDAADRGLGVAAGVDDRDRGADRAEADAAADPERRDRCGWRRT